MSIRNQLLGSALKVGSVASKVELNIQDNVVVINLCRPSLAARDKMQKLMQGGEVAISEIQARCIIATARDDEGKPVFSDGDLPALNPESLACGDWFDELAQEAFALVFGKPKELEGNSRA